MIEKTLNNYDDATDFLLMELDRLTDLEPEGHVCIDVRYVGAGWQVALWIDNDMDLEDGD